MALKLYNNLTRQKEDFVPLDPGHVRMYVCGPTVYNYAHIGNARPVVVFDTLYRLLRRLYPRVTYARNITDIDDKIIVAARDLRVDISAITEKYAEIYRADMAALGALPPDIEPRATASIPAMIELIETLVANGHAYAAEGHVLFHVPSMADYGKLSRRSQDDMIAGARVEVAPYKKSPADFVLWKPSSDDQPGWDSPWGRGRPGWHLECSAMIAENLGETIDIHGGGIDLQFPHHENEIAQSECAHHGAPLARYWLHNGFVLVNGEKMSKSLGNFFTVHDLLDKHGYTRGEAIRLLLLSTHYRQPMDFTEELLEQAKSKIRYWIWATQDVEEGAVPERVMDAFLDDLNTPKAIQEMDQLTDLSELKASAKLLGLLRYDLSAWDKDDPGMIAATQYFKKLLSKENAAKRDAEIDEKVAKRTAARKAKNFAESDRIRDELAAQGIILEDGPQGTTWRRA